MDRHTPNASRIVFGFLTSAIVLFLGGCTGALPPPSAANAGNSDDAAVLKAILEDFTDDSDAPTPRKRGMFLIVPDTSAISAESADWMTKNPGERCKDLSMFREPLLRRRGSILLASIVAASPTWRIAKDKETTADIIALGPNVETRIELTTPVYTGDGNSALVVVHFLWSIHTAQRTYVVARANGAWRVRCADSIYTV